MTETMRLLEEKYNYPVDIEYACNFDSDGSYRVNLLQCRPLQTRGIGKAGVMPKIKEKYFRTEGSFIPELRFRECPARGSARRWGSRAP